MWKVSAILNRDAFLQYSVCIFNKDSRGIIVGTSGPKVEAKQLSAMQIAKGAKKGEPTFLVTLKVCDETVEPRGDDVPPIIWEVLEENKNVMLHELPKVLPSRREMDHRIELDRGGPMW